ncbi:MAG TPA: ceramide glucosyltransferase [Stellaceae bacterium]|nr:ceramide glucosyltransferase [Stellaceae bacterium]
MIFAEWAALFAATASGAHFASLCIAGWRCGRRGRRPAADCRQPGVSIVVPVCGLDNFATETLASSLRLDYPEYEVIFCAARADDRAVPLVRRLIEACPGVSARLLIGDDPISINPKLNNCVKGWNAARHQWIVLADSNLLLPPDYIDRLLARWQQDTGAVCSMPLGTRPHNFWAELECAFLNTFQARCQYVGETLGFGFAQGKTLLYRRDIVDRAGGIRALAAEPAEDAATTKLVRRAGHRVQLVDAPFEQPLGRRRAVEVWSRQLRWARLRRATFPLLFAPEAVVGSCLPAVAAAVAAAHLGIEPAAAGVGLIALWTLAELMLARRVGWHCSPGLAAAIVVRDLLLPALWIAAICGDEFTWRGTSMSAADRMQTPSSAEPATLRAN